MRPVGGRNSRLRGSIGELIIRGRRKKKSVKRQARRRKGRHVIRRKKEAPAKGEKKEVNNARFKKMKGKKKTLEKGRGDGGGSSVGRKCLGRRKS